MSERTVKVIKKQERSGESRDNINDRKDSLLKTIDHFEAQAGRLMQMAREIRAEVLSLKN